MKSIIKSGYPLKIKKCGLNHRAQSADDYRARKYDPKSSALWVGWLSPQRRLGLNHRAQSSDDLGRIPGTCIPRAALGLGVPAGGRLDRIGQDLTGSGKVLSDRIESNRARRGSVRPG